MCTASLWPRCGRPYGCCCRRRLGLRVLGFRVKGLGFEGLEEGSFKDHEALSKGSRKRFPQRVPSGLGFRVYLEDRK